MTDTTVETKSTLSDSFNTAFAESMSEVEAANPDSGQKPLPFDEGEDEGANTTVGSVEPQAQAQAPTPETPAEETFRMNPEQLERIKADPVLSGLYKSLLKGSTQKFQEVAEARKAIEADSAFLDAVRKDPAGVLQAAAQQMGMRLVSANDQAAASRGADLTAGYMPKLAELFGQEGAQQVAPVFREMITEAIRNEVAPLKENVDNFTQQRVAEQASNIATSFREKHGITPDVEAQMMELAVNIQPASNVSPEQFLEYLHSLVTAKQAPAAAAKEVGKRIQASKASLEPTRRAPVAKAPKQKAANMEDAWARAGREAMEELGLK